MNTQYDNNNMFPYGQTGMMADQFGGDDFGGGFGDSFGGDFGGGLGDSFMGNPVMPDGTKRPTGGLMAYQMKMNPYLSPSGNFRKPRHDEMIKEIQIFKGLTASGRAVRVSDVNHRIRHCCVTRPYFHVLSAEKYRVVLPNNEIEVIYYAHRECDTLIVVGDTLSE